MKTKLVVGASAIAATFLVPSVAYADTAPWPTDNAPCSTNVDLQNWHVNADETDVEPAVTTAGLVFTSKDLIHHATNMSLADVRAESFVANGDADKVVAKFETDSPYTSIIQTPDGKYWSSHIASGTGSQSAPVDTVADLIGIPATNASGGLTVDTKVVSFGVGYWTVLGTTTVSSITFHGTKYDTKCEAAPAAPKNAGPIRNKVTTAAKTSIKTTFGGAANAIKYNVFLDGKLWKTVTGSPFTVSPLKAHTKHTIGLQAVAANGSKGPISNTTIWTLSK